ncbi:MAG: pyruvate dehydrogenase complex dihydrolipoamide acetyltransferase [Armatimonadaceae bacterium]
MAEVKMPRAGDAMEEGVIVQWLKNVGDKVGPDDPIMEIETDKSNLEVPAEVEGYVQQLLFKAGDSVQVGKAVAVIGPEPPAAGSGSAAPSAPAAETRSEEAAPPPDAEPVREEEPQPTRSNGADAPKTAAPAPTTTATPKLVKPTGAFKPYNSYVGAMPENLGGSASIIGEPIVLEGEGTGERFKASPVARAMAQTHSLDLTALRGTGPDGSIVKADVEAALAGGANGAPAQPQAASATKETQATKPAPAAAPTLATANEGDEVQEFNGMRRTIARRMTESKSTIPHYYVSTEIDMEALMALRTQINASAGESQPKISINDFMIKAVAVALQETPNLNAAFGENKRILRKSFNIGFGVSLEDGLIVPVVRNCESKSLRAIARETKPLIEKARAGKLAPADYSGGTFTISNLGVMPDITEFTAIINPGEGAILAIASTREVPAVVDGQVVPRKRMKVTLSADHRVSDGADGANFVLALKRVIENPLEILV